DFAKSERLLRETVAMMGSTHPVAMLAMKTLGGIASEQKRFDDALQVSLDLLDAQISTFGVNHAETSRTVNTILDMCKDLGKDQIAEDIATLVKKASEVEKTKTTQSLQRLRGGVEDPEFKKNSPGNKIGRFIDSVLAKLFKKS
ncbi:MAG: tetratricopeptide repeat protein, partial [Candidatus Melainabacteria bacterium]|nr:tetratricopeptide repeat protein [Candidatus Melainabacteria bacterium]